MKIMDEIHYDLIKHWVSTGSLFEDASGNGFVVNISSSANHFKYFFIPSELTGFFRPVEFYPNVIDAYCDAQLIFGKIEVHKVPPTLCKLYKCKKVIYYPNKQHNISLLSAISFASFHHSEQKRKFDQTPYIMHLIEVADLVSKYASDENIDILNAAVLHDVVEDTPVSFESLQLFFGIRVRKIVETLTYSGSESGSIKAQGLLLNLNSADTDSKIIKLADIISNIKSLPDWDQDRKTRYIKCCDVVADKCKSSSPKLFELYKDIRFNETCTALRN